MFRIAGHVAGDHRVFAPLQVEADISGAFDDIAGHHDADHADAPDAAVAGRGVLHVIVAEPEVAGARFGAPVILAPELDAVLDAAGDGIAHGADV